MSVRYSLPRRPPKKSLEADAVRLPDDIWTAAALPPDSAIYVNDVCQIFGSVFSDVRKMAQTMQRCTHDPQIPADL